MSSIETIVKLAESGSEVKTALELRNRVFCEEQGFSRDIEQDGEDEHAGHIIAVSGGRTVGCGRIRFFGSEAKLERIAVDSSLRGTGIGKQILSFMIDYCRSCGTTTVKLSAQISSLKFYLSNGFAADGEPFEVEGVGHQMMIRSVRKRT